VTNTYTVRIKLCMQGVLRLTMTILLFFNILTKKIHFLSIVTLLPVYSNQYDFLFVCTRMYFFISPTSLRRKENFIIMKAQKHEVRLVAKLVRFSEKRRRVLG